MSNIHFQYGLQIFDLSNPLTPTLISNYHPGDNTAFETVRIRDDLLYATGYNALRILDLSTPAMSVVGSIAVQGNLVTLDGNTAYLNWSQSKSTYTCYGYHAVDVTNPFSPTLMLTHQFGCSDWGSPTVVLTVANQRLYAGNYPEDKLYIYELTDPDMPTLLGTYKPLGEAMFANGQYAYLSGGLITGMNILDVSGATTPTLVSTYSTIGNLSYFIKRDPYLFAGSSQWINVLDITNPASPIGAGSVAPIQFSGYTPALKGDYLYIDGVNERSMTREIRVLDISNPIQPTEVAFYGGDVRAPAISMAVSTDNRLYVSLGYDGLMILKLSGTISGKIVDSFGNAHAGVKVILSSGQSTETNDQGDYSFASLIPGSYTVKAESSTYDVQPAERTLRVPSYSSDAINFTLLLKPFSAAVTPDAPTHLSYTDLQGNELEFDLPVGVVAQPTTLSVLPQIFASAPGQFFTGVHFDLQLGEANSAGTNFTFAVPLTITIHYTDSAVASVSALDQLMLHWWNGNEWVDATTTCPTAKPAVHDLENQVLATTACQSGPFALFGPTVQHFLPIISRSPSVSVSEIKGRFAVRHGDKCLSVLEESQQNGANLDQMPCDNRDSEIWTVRPQGEYAQLAAKHSQKCLRVESQVEGAPVIQWSCTGADAELWRLVSIDSTGSSGDTFWLVNKQSGLCLTVQDASQEDRAQVMQSSCSESPNQTWRFQAQN